MIISLRNIVLWTALIQILLWRDQKIAANRGDSEQAIPDSPRTDGQASDVEEEKKAVRNKEVDL